MDPALLAFDTVWAAAGTPRHIFAIAPSALQRLAGAELAAFTQPTPPIA
jgi:prolyl-tRNA editing enzyme YbaK/EbsC (Cys-tRNA(Pro) deacylase)